MKAQDTSELFFDNIRIPATKCSGMKARLCVDDDELSSRAARPGHPLGTVVETVL